MSAVFRGCSAVWTEMLPYIPYSNDTPRDALTAPREGAGEVTDLHGFEDLTASGIRCEGLDLADVSPRAEALVKFYCRAVHPRVEVALGGRELMDQSMLSALSAHWIEYHRALYRTLEVHEVPRLETMPLEAVAVYGRRFPQLLRMMVEDAGAISGGGLIESIDEELTRRLRRVAGRDTAFEPADIVRMAGELSFELWDRSRTLAFDADTMDVLRDVATADSSHRKESLRYASENLYQSFMARYARSKSTWDNGFVDPSELTLDNVWVFPELLTRDPGSAFESLPEPLHSQIDTVIDEVLHPVVHAKVDESMSANADLCFEVLSDARTRVQRSLGRQEALAAIVRWSPAALQVAVKAALLLI